MSSALGRGAGKGGNPWQECSPRILHERSYCLSGNVKHRREGNNALTTPFLVPRTTSPDANPPHIDPPSIVSESCDRFAIAHRARSQDDR